VSLPSVDKIATALGGEVSAGEVLGPGPGHSPADRSLSVKPDADAPEGFLVHSFSGDDPIACRDYVRSKLGLPEWKPNGARKANGKAAAKPYSPTVATFVYRDQDGKPYLQVKRCGEGLLPIALGRRELEVGRAEGAENPLPLA
jgi:hypothetical protein